jgi:hypothetical protein
MQTAPISASQSTQQTQNIDGYAYLQKLFGLSPSADPNGPFGKWLAEGEKAAKWLFSQNLSDKQSSNSQFMAAQYPQAYSSDQISPEVQQNPNAYLDGYGDHGSIKCMNFSPADSSSEVSADPSSDDSNAVCDQPTDDGGTVAGYGDAYESYVSSQQMSDTGDVSGSDVSVDYGDGGTIDGYSQQYDDYIANNTDNVGYSTSGDSTGYGDGGTIDGYGQQFNSYMQGGDYGLNPRGPMVTDPSIESPRQVAASSGFTPVRDHMPPPSPAPVVAAPVGISGNGFTSGAEFQKIADFKAQADAAQDAAIQNPNDPQLAQAAQDALEQYQLEVARARQESAMMAQQAMDALKASKLN